MEKYVFSIQRQLDALTIGNAQTLSEFIQKQSRYYKEHVSVPEAWPALLLSDKSIQIHLDLFFEDWFSELSVKYGIMKRLSIASNSCTQLLENIYIMCADKIKRRHYGGRKTIPELGELFQNRKMASAQTLREVHAKRKANIASYLLPGYLKFLLAGFHFSAPLCVEAGPFYISKWFVFLSKLNSRNLANPFSPLLSSSISDRF